MADSKIFRDEKQGNLLVTANTKFAFSLLKKLAEQGKENVFFSPLSISIGLGITHLGARGKTYEEMHQTLGFSDVDDQALHPAFSDLRRILQDSAGKYQLHAANRLFGEKSYKFLEAYLNLTKEHYGAVLAPVDFVSGTEQARLEINKWVEDQTNKRIQNLIPSGVLDSLTRLVLVNAIYFKGDWLKKFDVVDTKDEVFHVTKDEKIKVPMMYKKAGFNYGMDSDLGVAALELPYLGEHLSMFLLLPSKEKSINDILGHLEVKDFTAIKRRFHMHSCEVHVYLPRFKLKQSFSLGEALASMGIKSLFVAGAADLSGIDGTEDLYVSKVLHKVFLEVNEEGSEAAAAATTVRISARGFSRSKPLKTEFRVDRPFILMIRDNRSQSALFLGKIVRPTRADVPKSKDEL